MASPLVLFLVLLLATTVMDLTTTMMDLSNELQWQL
jgi:hypothetical protein